MLCLFGCPNGPIRITYLNPNQTNTFRHTPSLQLAACLVSNRTPHCKQFNFGCLWKELCSTYKYWGPTKFLLVISSSVRQYC